MRHLLTTILTFHWAAVFGLLARRLFGEPS